ncbi:MAG: YjgN family protein [Burkholderiales bacterium]
MNEANFDPQRASAAALPTATNLGNSIRTLPITFTGTGSEYFRIWIVNLLLIIVTLSLYTPWARARKLRYFHGNTSFDGHPLAFHGDPKKMFRGYLLVGAMVIVYSVAGQFSATAGFLALLIVALVWPALLKSSMQFRLANTSWRGLRFRFTGTVRGAYEAMLPLFVPSAMLLGLIALLDPEQQQHHQPPPDWFGLAMLLVFALMLLTAPWLWWKFKHYQHENYSYASLQTRFKASTGSFYGVFLKTAGVSLMSAVLVGVVVAVVAAVVAGLGLAGGGLTDLDQNKGVFVLLALVLPPLMFLAVMAVYVVGIPYFTSRMQNLVWSKTGSREFRFQSALTFRSALKLTLKNWFLIGLTLGLYWPFAAVAMARLKLEAMAVLTRVDPQSLISRTKTLEGEAAGDAAGDLFGVDIGL